MTEADDPKTMTDAELLSAYDETSGEAGDPIADVIMAVIRRRGLDT